MVRQKRLVRRQFGIRQQRGQKEPTAELFVEQQGVLSDPSQSGQLGKVAFHQWSRIDHATDASGRYKLVVIVA